MNQDTEEFRRILFEADFEFSLNVVHTGERQIVRQCAVTGNEKMPTNALQNKFVYIENFGELRGHGSQSALEFGIADQSLRRLDGRGLALDVRQDVGDFGNVAPHCRFQLGDLIVGLLHRHALIKFHVLLHVNLTRDVLHTDVVDVQVVASGNGANAIENIFRTLGARQRLHGDVSIGKDAVNGFSRGCHQLARALKGHGTRQADGKVGEVAIAGAANPDAIDFKHSIDARDRIDDLGAHPCGGGVEQGIDGSAGQTPAYGNHESGNEKCRDGVGVAKPSDLARMPYLHQHQSKDNHAARPDIGGEVQGIGLQRLAVVLACDTAEGSGSPPVHNHREQHYAEGRYRRLDLDV